MIGRALPRVPASRRAWLATGAALLGGLTTTDGHMWDGGPPTSPRLVTVDGYIWGHGPPADGSATTDGHSWSGAPPVDGLEHTDPWDSN